jgi:phage shock protein PspC (stress-responsive transcriptional regulator)
MAPAAKDQKARRLTKSRKDKIIDGVCAGVAEYLGIDAVVVRIVWGFSIVLGGLGAWLYIASMILIPADPEPVQSKEEDRRKHGTGFVLGVLLILFGALVLSHHFHPICFRPFPFFFGWHPFGIRILPVCLIAAGLAILSGSFSTSPPGKRGKRAAGRLACSSTDRKIGGVCGGLAGSLGVDPSVVRLIAVVLLMANAPVFLALYAMLWIVLPKTRDDV